MPDKWDKFVAPASAGGDKWDKFVVNEPSGVDKLRTQNDTYNARLGAVKPDDPNPLSDDNLRPYAQAMVNTGGQAIGAGVDALKATGKTLLNQIIHPIDNSPIAAGYQQAKFEAEHFDNPATPTERLGQLGIDVPGAKQAYAEGNVPSAIQKIANPAIQALILKKVGDVAGSFGTPKPANVAIPEAAEIHGAALRNAGGAPAKAAIGDTTSTTTPAMLEAADQMGVTPKNVTASKWSAVSERAIENQESAFNSLVKQADPQTPIAAETKAAADALRHEALSERNPNVAAKLNEVADRIEKETTLEGGNALRQSLNKETIAHHRKVNVSDANADLVNEANLNAVGKMRDIVYGKTGQQLGIPQEAIQQLKMRSSALIRQNDWVQNARKLIENDRLVEKNTGFVNKARYNNQLPNASKGGVTSAVGKSVLGGRDAAFRSQLSKFLEAPRVPVQYPTANAVVANQSRLAGIVRRAGLNQPSTDVPPGAARTPLDEFLRQNPPAYQQPDMGQAGAAWASDPAYPVNAPSQPIPRRGNIMLQDIEAAGPPPPPAPYNPVAPAMERPWYQSDQWTRPSGRSTDVSAAELSMFIRSHGKRR